MLNLEQPAAIRNSRCLWTEALGLARRGISVFPCDPHTKRPFTKNGFKDATADADCVHECWTAHPDALIGVPTGPRFVVIDLDLQHADAVEWLQQNRHRLPLTRTHSTRSGGKHYLFAPTDKVRCSAGKLGPHIDTRGHGGYIIWWPACGLEVLHGGVLAEFPEWICRLLEPPPVRETYLVSRGFDPDRSIDGIIRKIAGAAEGERNHITFWGACRLAELVHEGKLGARLAVDIVVEAAARAGLHHVEARRTAQSAFRTIGI
jgi:Bifunctional DNA primase/polymerase, N-terminal